MGILGEIFISDEQDLKCIDYKNSNPLSFFEGIEADGFEVVKMATLQELLTNESFDDILDQQNDFYTESKDGPWIIELPQKLIESLDNSDTNTLDIVFNKWIQTEEFQFEPWDSILLKNTFEKLVELAKKAKSINKRIFIWNSL